MHSIAASIAPRTRVSKELRATLKKLLDYKAHDD